MCLGFLLEREMRNSQQPTLSENSTEDDQIYTHPAYGLITMTTRTGGNQTLFGSDIGHNQSISIKIALAEHSRHLSSDWNHGIQTICEFHMSHAQFARFITSGGNGNGTPITLELYRDESGNSFHVPTIEKIQTKHETHHQEIKNSCAKAIKNAQDKIAELEILIAGKPTKKQLLEAIKSLESTVNNMPSTVSFTVKQAEKALEKATSDAMIEVESCITMSATRIGLKHINDLARIENKSE